MGVYDRRREEEYGPNSLPNGVALYSDNTLESSDRDFRTKTPVFYLRPRDFDLLARSRSWMLKPGKESLVERVNTLQVCGILLLFQRVTNAFIVVLLHRLCNRQFKNVFQVTVG